MNTIVSKYRVGDKVFTFEKNTMKTIEVTIAMIVITLLKTTSRIIIYPLKENGDILDYGKYATAEHPELCYLIVYDPVGNICALLGKGTDVRKNLKTGKDDSIKNYRGCGAIWFTLREDERMKN